MGVISMPDYENVLIGFLGVFIAIFAVASLVGLVFYILRGLGLYTLAKRRGIPAPILAWIPVLTDYTLGALADNIGEYENRRSYHRFILPGCQILSSIVGIFMISPFLEMIQAMTEMSMYGDTYFDPYTMMGSMSTISGLTSLFGILYTIFSLMAFYKIMQLYNPRNATLYTVLGFFFNFLRGVFLFTVRNAPDPQQQNRDQSNGGYTLPGYPQPGPNDQNNNNPY
jgi:hypothetical protein